MSNFIKIHILKTSICLFLLGLTFGLNAQISVTFETVTPSCHNYTDGSATAIVTGGTAPYIYIWSNGSDDDDNLGLGGGSYSLTVTDATGASTSGSVNLNPPEALITSIIFDGDLCDSGAGTLTGNVTGGTTPYTYLWSTGSTEQIISDLAPGGYVLTVTDANGCGNVDYYQVRGPLSVDVNTIDVVCHGYCDASANAIVEGGVTPYSYVWNTGGTGSHIYSLPIGDYCVTVTDGNGCIATNCETITEPPALITSITLIGDCNGSSDISASVDVSGGVPEYSIVWSNGATGTDISGLEAQTTYSVTVTDANGCDDIESITTGDVSQLSITISGENESCAGENDGAASITPGGGLAPYTILWSTGSNDETIEDLTPGNYGVTVTDVNGCTGIQSVTVAEGTLVSVLTETTASDCGDNGTGSFSLTPSGGMEPYSFVYENGIGNPTSGDVSNLNAGSYNVTISDAQGCKAMTTINVPQATEFTVSTSVTPTTCNDAADGTASVVNISGNAAQPVTYLWDNGSMNDSTDGLSAGEHNVTVTDANGCVNIETVTIEATDAISAIIEITPNDCTGTSISVNVSANSTGNIDDYVYSVNDEIFTTADFVLDIPAGETIMISLVATNEAGCTAENEITFTAESFEPTVPETVEGCLGESLTASANSGADDTYEWTSEDDIFIGSTDIANPEINTSIAGEFPAEVTITNPQGCSITEAVTISISDIETIPDPNLISSTQSCDGTVVDFINANDSANDYEWIFDYPNGETVSGGAAGSYEFPDAGIYELALIPTIACADTVIIEVEVTEPQVAAFTFESNCEDGFVVVFTDMSSNPDDITDWNWEINGEMYNEQNPSVEFETAGTIDAILTVSYGDDCVLETMQPVDVAPFNPTTPVNEMVDCGGGNPMELFPNANPDYEYEWSPAGGLSDPNAPNPTATVTETTIYMVTITDPETGCTELSEIILNVPAGLTGPNLDDISLCQSENETADATVAGGLNYTWSDDENFNNILSEEAVYGFTVTEVETTYYVLIEDEFGCTITESFTAGAYPIDFDFGAIKLTCEGDIVTYDLPDGLTVDWGGDDPADTPIFEEDFFVGTITNEANCSLQDTLFAEAVIITEGLEIDANPDTILLGDVSELFVTPDDRFTYEWDNAETLNDSEIHNPTAKPEETTTYTVTIRDGDGCEDELDVEVVVENNCEPFLYFPNAFTPDDDGLNDVLFVEGLSLEEVFFAIYNRWGEKVYESNSITEGWDGKFNGEVVCPDVYGYYLRVRCTDGNEIFRKGNVSVLR